MGIDEIKSTNWGEIVKNPAKFILLIVLLGVNLLAGSGYAATDACALLKKDDVSKVLGQAVETVAGKGLGGVCTYNTKISQFELTVTHSGGTDYIKGIREKLGKEALVFSGIGDEAVYNPYSYSLIVRKGDAAYLINFHDSSHQMSDKDKQAKQKALAVLLMGSLH